MKNRKMLGNLLLMLTALIWGTAFAFQRKGMESIEPMTFTSARMAVSAVVAGLAALLFRNSGKGAEASGEPSGDPAQRRKYTLLGGLCCGAFLTAATLFQQMGIVDTTAGKAGFITALYIILVPVIETVLFRKKSRALVWVSVAIGVVGMYLLCIRDRLTLTHGDALVCVCAVLFSGHILCCDFFSRRGEPVRIAALQFTVCAVVAGIGALLFETPGKDKLLSALIPILYCGVLSGGIGYTLQLVAQRWTDPTTASLLMSLESVFAVIGGAVLLNERMTPRELLGCAVMFIAIILIQLPEDFFRRKAPAGNG